MSTENDPSNIDETKKLKTDEVASAPPAKEVAAPISTFDEVDESAIDVGSPPASESTTAKETNAQVDIQDMSDQIDYGPNEKVTLTLGNPLNEPLKTPFLTGQDYLDIPSLSLMEYGPVTSTYKNYQLAKNEDTARWRNSAAGVSQLYLAGAAFEKSFSLEGTHWRQSMEAGTEEIRADRPKFVESNGNRLSGEEARLRIRAVLDAGNRVRVPLWHSGIWITIKAPTEAALLELDQRIANLKIELGRLTNGLVYSATSVYMTDSVVEFILEHVSETSYQGEIAELPSIILQPDYQQMVWGLLCAIYTDGYVYQQPCMLNPFKCLHVETARLNFGKMSFVNNNAFTDFQRQHMRKRKGGSQSKLDVERYQSEHKFQKNAVVKLHDKLSMEMKVPTLTEYTQSGRDWIDSNVAAVDSVFGKALEKTERDEHLRSYASLTALQQYSHWIKLLSLTDDDKHVEDRDSIQDVLSDLTSDDAVYKNFFEGAKTYIDGIMINIHGIPKYPCPSCQGLPAEETLKHPMIFPIDLQEAFFTVVVQRIRRMLDRRSR